MVIILSLLFLVLVFAVYMGIFSTVDINESHYEGRHVYYKEFASALKNIGSRFNDVYQEVDRLID